MILEGQVKVDMRHDCPKDVKKMLLKQARSTYCKKWAAKHEYEELKEGVWLEPALALLRRRTKEEWTDKHCNVASKLEGGWVACRRNISTLVGQMKESVKIVTQRKVQKKHRLYHCQGWNELRRQISEAAASGNKKRERQRRTRSGKEVM